MNSKTRKLLLISFILAIRLIPFPDIVLAGVDKSQSVGKVTISGIVMDKAVQIDGHTCNLIGAGLLR